MRHKTVAHTRDSTFQLVISTCSANVRTDPTTGRPAVVTLGNGAVHSVVTLAVVPIKDQTGKAKRFPCPIISKHPAADIAAGRVDLTCPYTAIRAAWDARIESAPWSELQDMPEQNREALHRH